MPLAVTLTEANQHDLRQLLVLLLKFPRVGGLPGRPRKRLRSVAADKGYDCHATRRRLRELGINPLIPRRGTRQEWPLGRLRWPVERTLSGLKQFRRLRIRWDRLEATCRRIGVVR